MKTIILFWSFILFISSISFAQRDERPREKIKALEKIKLLEALDLGEETAVKFFSRRKEHQENTQGLFNELDEKRDLIKNKISTASDDNDPELKKLVDSYFLTQQKLNDERKRFFNSLTDILTNKQIAELIIFEKRFREEIRDVLFHKKRKIKEQYQQ